MPEDIDFGKLYEGLDQIPGLIENAKRQDLRDKANAEKFKEIKDDVSDMKTEISSLKSELASFKTVLTDAKAAFQKPVTIQDKNIHITKDEIRVTQSTPDWVRAMGSEYQEIKNKELSRKQKNIVTIGGPRFSTFLAIFFFAVIMIGSALFLWAYSQSKNSAEAYAERAYNAAVECDYENPGNYYFWVRKKWDDEKENMKRSVERWEDYAKFHKSIKKALAPFYEGKDIIVDATDYEGKDILAFWHFKDEDPDYIVHFWPNGKIDVADAKKITVTSLKDAHRMSKHKAWSTLQEAIQEESTE